MRRQHRKLESYRERVVRAFLRNVFLKHLEQLAGYSNASNLHAVLHACSRAKRLSQLLCWENATGHVFFFPGIFQEQISSSVQAISITITATAKTSTTSYPEIKSMMFSAFL